MPTYSENIFYEDNKVLITKDKFNFIVREKPIDSKHPYRNASYLANKGLLLWELVECRKLYSKEGKEASIIAQLLNKAETTPKMPISHIFSGVSEPVLAMVET